jgi:hypothetical protein
VHQLGRAPADRLEHTPVYDRDGRVAGSTAIGEDITARRRQELADAVRATQQAALARIGLSGLRDRVSVLMDAAVRELPAALPIEMAAVLLCRPGDDALLMAAAAGWPEGMAGGHLVDAAPGSLVHRVLEQRRPGIDDVPGRSRRTTCATAAAPWPCPSSARPTSRWAC